MAFQPASANTPRFNSPGSSSTAPCPPLPAAPSLPPQLLLCPVQVCHAVTCLGLIQPCSAAPADPSPLQQVCDAISLLKLPMKWYFCFIIKLHFGMEASFLQGRMMMGWTRSLLQ